jgi:hypothetical protein
MSTRIELTHATVLFSDRAEGDLGRPLEEPNAAIRANRAAIQALCGVHGIAVGRQIHGATVQVAADHQSYVVDETEADGQATRTPGLGVGVHVADCLPIAIAGAGGVVMLHGGWRGLAAGIIDAGVAALRALGVEGPLEAAIGPGAGGCCYETGPEVHAALDGYGASNGRLFDLGAVATAQLHAAGVASVSDVGVCTLCAPPGLLFSHRRDGPTGERQGGFAWLR